MALVNYSCLTESDSDSEGDTTPVTFSVPTPLTDIVPPQVSFSFPTPVAAAGAGGRPLALPPGPVTDAGPGIPAAVPPLPPVASGECRPPPVIYSFQTPVTAAVELV